MYSEIDEKCKKFLVSSSILWCIAIVVLILGSVMLDDSLEFKRNSEKSTCTIQSYTSSSCSYDCNCYKDKDGHEHCDTCYGYKYEYYATSPLCGDTTLHQNSYDDNGSCPQTMKSIGYSNTCWVICDESEFSFSSPTSLIAGSIVLLVVGGCCCCGGFGVACCNKTFF